MEKFMGTGTVWWKSIPWLARGSSMKFPSDADEAKAKAAAMDAEISICLNNLTAPDAGWLELAACYENRLYDVTSQDLHGHFHLNGLGGDSSAGASSFLDPPIWLHHAGGDRLRMQWQFRNAHLRPTAYNYPAISAYNLTDTALDTCVGCAAYNLGFSAGLVDGTATGTYTAGDVLCAGDLERLYTYDVILEEYAQQQEASAHHGPSLDELYYYYKGVAQGAIGVAVVVLFVVVLAVLVWRSQQRNGKGLRYAAAQPPGDYDMKLNDAASSAAVADAQPTPSCNDRDV